MRWFKKKSKIRFLSLLTTGLLYLSLCLSTNVYAANSNASIPVDAKDEVYKSEPVVVSEDTSLRGEYEKHFQKSDGSYAVATYAMPVHYQDEATGDWNEIDNRLVESTDKNGGVVYRNRDGLFDVSFARTPGANSAELVTMESEGHTLSWTLISLEDKINSVKLSGKTNKERTDIVLTGTPAELIETAVSESVKASDAEKITAEKAVSALVYNDLADQDTDVRFTVTPLKVKEDYLLDRAPEEAVSYTTRLTLSDGLTPTVLEYGDISIADDEGREIFYIASPYMTDAADEVSSDIAVDFKRDGDGWRLTVTPDLAWLQDDARVYPVTVDPTVYATNNAANTWDTYIYEDSTSSGGRSRQDLDRMYVGNRSSAQKKCRGLIKFLTMPTISGTITGATLTLTTPSGTSTWQGMTLYRITEDWVSESVAWPGPDVDFLNSACASGGKYVFGVTTAIQDMYRYSTAASSNYGFEVRYTNESINDYNSICSSEHGTDTDVNSTKPYLVINYDYYAPEPTPGIVSGDYYYFRSVKSGRYMDVSNSGGSTTPVVQYTLNGGANQRWRVVYEENGWYSLTPAYDLNLRLDVPGGNRTNGQDLWVYNSNNTSTQRWRIIPNGDGTYRLMPMCAQHENKVIDVESASLANSAPLQIWTWDGISPQMKWIIETGYTLNTPQIGQEQSKWCWAACAQMAARTLVPSSTITQTDIVREIKGTVINKGGTSAECAQGANFAAYNKVYFIALDYPLSEKELLNYLRYDMPVIMCLTTYNSDGTVKSSHDVVAHGYYINWNGELVYQIRNPSPIGSGRSEDMTYEDLIGANGATRWVRTVAQQMIWGQNV